MNTLRATAPTLSGTMGSVFEPGGNCWRVARASYASMLIDCAAYYRTLHRAICEARRSVFVLGWDLDSRIELLRGEEAEGECPSRFFDLIQWKARRDPEVRIYLNRWHYSIYMAADKEGFSRLKWNARSPANVRFCLDGKVPLGASHHQKVVVIDDEIAFCGGMDVAIGRWDHRHHRPRNRNRIDPGVLSNFGRKKKFGPYHDVQVMVTGDAARALAELARRRWKEATGEETVPMPPARPVARPEWREPRPLDMHDVRAAVALTMPPWRGLAGMRHAERLYLDLIARAERFIYMENQYFTCQAVARALNARLRENPDLRVLLVSCYDPEGIMERKVMWHGRVHFRDALEAGGVGERAVMAYPTSREEGREKPVRIHSKVMIVDDRYLRVGSSNVNRRSMGLDTECDLVMEAEDDASRAAIAAVRADLIREHTGREVEDINHLIESGAPAERFLHYVPHSRQHLNRIDDEKYRYERFAALATWFGDSDKPLLAKAKAKIKAWLTLRFLLGVLAVIGLAAAWKATPLADLTPEKLAAFFEQARSLPWAEAIAVGIYALGCMCFIPHVIMTGAAVAVFPPLHAFFIAIGGSLLSGAIGFGIGKALGERTLKALIGGYAEKLSSLTRRGGVIGIALIRLLPVAPFTVVNMALGMSGVSAFAFTAGTFLALFPGIAAFAFLGHSLTELWEDPDPVNVFKTVLGVALWAGIVFISHWLSRKERRQMRQSAAT